MNGSSQTSNVLKKYPPRTMLVLSISQIICGIISIGLGIASWFLKNDEYYPAIWFGVVYCVAGSLGIPAAKTKRRGFVITFMILSIVCAALCAVPFITYIVYLNTPGYVYDWHWDSEYITNPPRITTLATTMDPKMMENHTNGAPDDTTYYYYYYRYNYYYYRRGYHVYHKIKDIFSERYGVYSVLVVISFIEAVIAIVSAVLCCRAVCKECCSNKTQQQQVYYFAASQPMIPINTMGASTVFTPAVQIGAQPTAPPAAQVLIPGKKGGYQKGVPIQLIPAYNMAGLPVGPAAPLATHTATPVPTQATSAEGADTKDKQAPTNDTPPLSMNCLSEDLQPLVE